MVLKLKKNDPDISPKMTLLSEEDSIIETSKLPERFKYERFWRTA